MKVYVIIMYRWGEQEAHSYLHSVELDETIALEKAKEEEIQRGGKYEAEVAEMEIGDSTTRKYIKNIFTRQSKKLKNPVKGVKHPVKQL